ncbi:DUF2934 domain-containing protein [Opitutus terrae]|uniref:DUF2934 domain-containing protein n=1 Tax=Opitutus terrae (strain DSM 11246 / JCM 15787 / PB90-1) TaxID=452637 RepID=B1ZME9_OPITP|nr:DUF2934 domain-containing protein [Opitutus terrae]ACB73402.1 hypothetical protein Oter_0111 [Opitutus terrae PB90-1]
MAPQHQPSPTPEEIAARATELWRLAGSPPGEEANYHAAAEAELHKQRELTERTANDPGSRGPSRPQR